MFLEIRGREALPFEGEVDLSYLSRWGEHPFPEPVSVKGNAADRGDFYEISYTAEFLYYMPCSRCLRPVREPRSLRFRHTALERAESGEPDDDLPIRDGVLDVDEMAASDLLLETEGITLCARDCKGICPVCGVNRNDANCGCETSPPDPRFDALRQFLDDETETP